MYEKGGVVKMASSEFTGASGTAIPRSNTRQAGDDVFSSTRDTAILFLLPRSSISLDQMRNDLRENAKTPYPIYGDFSASTDSNKRSVARGDPAGAKLCPMPPRACELSVGTAANGLNGNSLDPGALAGPFPGWRSQAIRTGFPLTGDVAGRRALTRPADVECFA